MAGFGAGSDELSGQKKSSRMLIFSWIKRVLTYE